MADTDSIPLAAGDKLMNWFSYGGAGVSVGTSLTLTDVGVIVGIVTAIITFAANMIYQRRKDRRDQQRHDLELERLRRLASGELMGETP